MRISIFTLLSVAICGLVTSCIPPYPPNYDPTLQQGQDPAQKPVDENSLITGEAQKQLDAVRNGLDNTITPDTGYDALPEQSVGPVTPAVKPGYKYATKVPGKPGFVFNPWTKNQVDVRGIPSGTLVRDPYDDDQTHKFRVP